MKFKPTDWIHLLCTLVCGLSFISKCCISQNLEAFKRSLNGSSLAHLFMKKDYKIMMYYQGIFYFSSIPKIPAIVLHGNVKNLRRGFG